MEQSLAGKLFNTISFTLLHSLWQGLLLTILIAVILLATKKSAPAFRYSLLTALLFCFIGTVATTFILLWQQSFDITTSFIAATTGNAATQYNWWNGVTGFTDQYATWIMALWTAVVFIKLLRMLVDLYYVNRLRRTGTSYPDESWILQLQQLSNKMGIRKKLLLFESQLVNIPMVAGHFKPVILLPLGMLSQLSMAEVEAVLLHELAHIRRHDYLVNLLQRITGILFFFNPAVLWLSALLRSERENCCDAMAISHTNDKITFIEALISVKQHAMPAAPLAMNFLGQQNVLLHRVNRIVHSRNKSLDRAELSFVGLSIIAAALYFIHINTTPASTKVQPLAAEQVPAASRLPAFTHDTTAILTRVKAGSDGPEVISHSFKEKTVTKKITGNTATIATKDLRQSAPTSAAMAGPVVMNNPAGDRYSPKADLLQAEKDRMQAELDRQQADRDRAQAALDRQQAEKDHLQAMKDRAQADKDRAQADKDRLQADKDRKQADAERQQADKERAQAMPDARLAANTH